MSISKKGGKSRSWPEFPWLTILIQPRKTIKAVVDSDQDRYTIRLVILTGITLGVSNTESYGDFVSWPIVLILVAFVGAVSALITWGIWGALFKWTGSWFGGMASSRKVRAAMAWSAVPYIASLAFWLPMRLFYSPGLLYSSDIDQNPFPLLFGMVLDVTLMLWWYFLFWKCFAEIQRLSLSKSILAIMIPFVVIVGALVGCGMLMMIE